MNVFYSFNELAAFSASEAVSCNHYYSVQNNEQKQNKPIYDHLDPNFNAGIRRMSEKEMDGVIHEVFLKLQEQIMKNTPQKQGENPQVKMKQQFNWKKAENNFRNVLVQDANLRKKFQTEGFMGILFENRIKELFPWDPKILTAGWKPPTPKEMGIENTTMGHQSTD